MQVQVVDYRAADAAEKFTRSLHETGFGVLTTTRQWVTCCSEKNEAESDPAGKKCASSQKTAVLRPPVPTDPVQAQALIVDLLSRLLKVLFDLFRSTVGRRKMGR